MAESGPPASPTTFSVCSQICGQTSPLLPECFFHLFVWWRFLVDKIHRVFLGEFPLLKQGVASDKDHHPEGNGMAQTRIDRPQTSTPELPAALKGAPPLQGGRRLFPRTAPPARRHSTGSRGGGWGPRPRGHTPRQASHRQAAARGGEMGPQFRFLASGTTPTAPPPNCHPHPSLVNEMRADWEFWCHRTPQRRPYIFYFANGVKRHEKRPFHLLR